MSDENIADVKLIIFEMCLIHTKVIIILINGSSDSNPLSTFTVLVVAALTKREARKRQRQEAKQAHNLLLNMLEFVCESYIFYASCMCRFMKSRNQQYYAYC